jgi:hypothetical protein
MQSKKNDGKLAGGENSLILLLQEMVTRRFGAEVRTDAGAATLSIARDRVTITDAHSQVIAESAVGCAKALGDDGDRIIVALDPLAVKLVRWYAAEQAREITDVVNGVIAGELGHVHEEVESGYSDDSPEHVREYVLEAIQRRQVIEAKAA